MNRREPIERLTEFLVGDIEQGNVDCVAERRGQIGRLGSDADGVEEADRAFLRRHRA